MQKLNIIFILMIISFISACQIGKEPVVYKSEYVQVKVPVLQHLERPKRPKYTINDTALSYLLKLKQYTITLETIIDKTKNNKERE